MDRKEIIDMCDVLADDLNPVKGNDFVYMDQKGVFYYDSLDGRLEREDGVDLYSVAIETVPDEEYEVIGWREKGHLLM